MSKPSVSMQIDLACGASLEEVMEKYDLGADVVTAGVALSGQVVKFRKAVLAAVMDRAMDGDLASIAWLEERGYAAQFHPVRRSSEDESGSSDS